MVPPFAAKRLYVVVHSPKPAGRHAASNSGPFTGHVHSRSRMLPSPSPDAAMPSLAAPLRPSEPATRATRAHRLTLAVSALALLAVTAAVDLAPALPQPPPVLDETSLSALSLPDLDAEPPASIEQLRARIAAVLEREGVPGVGIALVDRHGVRWAGGVGLADLDTRRPVDADTQFRVGSITKSIVALGVMRLVEQGRLDLDRPLAELMPEIELHNDWHAEAPITLAHALEHTAGFDDMRFGEWFSADEALAPRDALAINPRSRVARWRPGSRMSYSNPGYTLAGHAIELATGERYDEYLEREILRPLGMHDARFRRTDEFADRLATGYRDRDTPAVFRPISHAPAGALLASPRELAQLVHFWLVRGDTGRAPIVSPAGLDRIERTGTLPYPLTDTNYGLGNYGDVLHRVRARGHDGGLPGFLSCYRYFPELGVGYVMLLNATHSTRAYLEIRALLFDYLTRGQELPHPPTVPPDPDAIARAAGYYAYANPRMELFGFLERALLGLRVRPHDSGLALEPLTGGDITLVPTGDGGYRLPHEGGTSIRLTDDTRGRRILVAGMAYFEDSSYALARARLHAIKIALNLILLAPLSALLWALRAGLRRLRGQTLTRGEAPLHLWPAAAALCFLAILFLFIEIARREVYATANPWTIGLCLTTLAFAACSAAALAEAIRAHLARTLPLRTRLLPSAAALACFGTTLYLLAHDIIGLRIWAW